MRVPLRHHIAYGPTLGTNIALGYLPPELAQVGQELELEYFDERYPVRVEAVGSTGLYDPENTRQKS